MNPMLTNILLGALVGWGVAARVDYLAFASWKNHNEALSYDWALAVWRWVQGAVIGAVTAATGGTVVPQ